eukprot:SAG31_NODE_167_length_21485_cov_31.094922_12_plen_637_part_00
MPTTRSGAGGGRRRQTLASVRTAAPHAQVEHYTSRSPSPLPSPSSEASAQNNHRHSGGGRRADQSRSPSRPAVETDAQLALSPAEEGTELPLARHPSNSSFWSVATPVWSLFMRCSLFARSLVANWWKEVLVLLASAAVLRPDRMLGHFVMFRYSSFCAICVAVTLVIIAVIRHTFSKVAGWVEARALAISFAVFAIVGSIGLLEFLGLLRVFLMVWAQAQDEDIKQWLDVDGDEVLSDAEYGLSRLPWCTMQAGSQILRGLGIDLTLSWKNETSHRKMTCCERCKAQAACAGFIDDERCQLILGDKQMQLDCSTIDEDAQWPPDSLVEILAHSLVEILEEMYKRPAIRVDLVTALIVTMTSFANAGFLIALRELKTNPTDETWQAEQSAKIWAMRLSEWGLPILLVCIPLLSRLAKMNTLTVSSAKLKIRSPDDLIQKMVVLFVHGDWQELWSVIAPAGTVFFAGYKLIKVGWAYAHFSIFKEREDKAKRAIESKNAADSEFKQWNKMNHRLVNFSMNTLVEMPNARRGCEYRLRLRTLAEVPLNEVIMEEKGQQLFREAFEKAYTMSAAGAADDFSDVLVAPALLNLAEDDANFCKIMCVFLQRSSFSATISICNIVIPSRASWMRLKYVAWRG